MIEGSIPPQCKEQRLHNSVWQRLKVRWNCGAHLPLFWSLCSLPHGVIEPLSSAPREYGAVQPLPTNSWRLCPAKLECNAYLGPQNHGDRVSETKKQTKKAISLYKICNTSLFENRLYDHLDQF